MSILDRTIVNIFNLPDLFTSKIPTYEDVFGVFVTIHRFKKLRNWPEDIHGCIGYWDNRYKKLSQQELYDKIMSVSKDAMFNDNRRFYFPSIENDPTSRIEISLMNIDGIINDLGVTFDNNKYGLIVDDLKGNRATFLPKVFENIDWKTIKKSIESKAGVKNNPSNTYWGFRKNGSTIITTNHGAAGSDGGQSLNTTIYLAANDYIDVYAQNTIQSWGDQFLQFSGHLVG